MAFNLRKRIPISYYEPEEPSFDDYVYYVGILRCTLVEAEQLTLLGHFAVINVREDCEQCSDYVFEYCALHGPLLVIPDEKVPIKTSFPSYVPRAALTIPHVFLHLAPSIIPGAGLGVFSTLTLPRGVRFGPYCGQRTQEVDSLYCWQVYDSNNKRSHVVDAVDGNRSNWMRYVNCARHWREQNLLAYQYQGQLYYRTIRIIPRFTELMVFYGSEFANVLHINLSKYNSNKYYEEVISTPMVSDDKKDDNITDHPSEGVDQNIDYVADEVHEEYIMNSDQFDLIDEKCDDKEDKQNDSSLPMESNNIPHNIVRDKIDENAPIKVTCIGDNININFNNITDDNRFKCELCQKTFAKAKYLKQHSHRHKMLKYKCEYCNFSTNFQSRYNEHVDKHTKTFLYSCSKCFYKTNIKRNFNKHYVRHAKNVNEIETISGYNDIYFSAPKHCDICEFETCSRKKFALHMSQHNGNIHKCDLCDYSSHCKYNVTRHNFRRHKN